MRAELWMSSDRLSTLSFDLERNCYIKNVVLFEENSILPLPERLEASGVESVWGEVSQESPREGPENLGRRRVPEVRDTEPNQ